MKLKDIWSAVIETGIGVCEIIVISAIGGYVLGLFQVGGLSFALTAYLVDLGAENLLLLLVICALTNIVLGLGLPTLAVYVMLAILVAPALVKVGVPADGGAPLHPVLRHHVADHAADRHRRVRRRHHRQDRPDGRRLDRDALRLGFLHRAVPLRLLARR